MIFTTCKKSISLLMKITISLNGLDIHSLSYDNTSRKLYPLNNNIVYELYLLRFCFFHTIIHRRWSRPGGRFVREEPTNSISGSLKCRRELRVSNWKCVCRASHLIYIRPVGDGVYSHPPPERAPARRRLSRICRRLLTPSTVVTFRND